jgi:hypothetical protein
LVISNSFAVDLLDKVGPCVANVRDVAVVSRMVNEKTDVIVTSLIGVVVV